MAPLPQLPISPLFANVAQTAKSQIPVSPLTGTWKLTNSQSPVNCG